MKNKRSRVLSRALALLLALTVVTSMGITVSADGGASGYTPTNGYVLQLGGGKINCYPQFSAYVPTVAYDGVDHPGYSIIFGMYDSYNDQTFENLYCTDMPVDAEENACYRRINLSDSTYAAALAGKLRGILLNTYPNITVEQLAAESGIAELTRDEAIAGTQLAVWQNAHGDAFEIKDFGAKDRWSNSVDEAVQGRIEALYTYLMERGAVAAQKILVSESSFLEHSAAPVLTENEDGTYNVTVTAKVFANVDAAAGDDLTLTAHMADGAYYVSTALSNGTKTYTLTIENVPAAVANDAVTLAIDGVQYAPKDVYLVDARGIRGVSQSLAGVMEGLLPVHAAIKAEPDRVLNIYKTELVDKGENKTERVPLENIAFDVYYVGAIKDYLGGSLSISRVPTDAEVALYAKSTNLVGTMTTDADGRASLNLHTEDGIYLVKELPNPAVESPCAPFYVMLPNWAEKDATTGTYPSYTVTAQPKNTTTHEGPEIDKSVTSVGNTTDSYGVGVDHTWIIRTTIPKTIALGKEYVITDTLDYRLSYQRFDKLELALSAGTAEPTALIRGTDYTVTEETVQDAEERDVTKLTISLTQTGMKKVGKLVGDEPASYVLRSSFLAQINRNAQLATEIPNDADVDYTNNVGKKFTATSEEAEVHTGGVKLLKVNSEQKPLAGATFELYRMATQAEVNADLEKNELPTLQLGETTYRVVRCAFYNSADLSGDAVTSLTTGADGSGYLYGLAYGDYYLVETQAPDGYNLLAAPVEVTINATSHTANGGAVTVVNTNGLQLPSTGGIGTGVYTAVGELLLCAAAILLLRRRTAR